MRALYSAVIAWKDLTWWQSGADNGRGGDLIGSDMDQQCCQAGKLDLTKGNPIGHATDCISSQGYHLCVADPYHMLSYRVG